MATHSRTRDLQRGTVVRVIYHTPTQTYNLEGVVTEDPSEAPGVMVSLEDDPYSPATTARVYSTHEAWLEARERCGRNDPLPGGYVRDRLRPVRTAEAETQVA